VTIHHITAAERPHAAKLPFVLHMNQRRRSFEINTEHKLDFLNKTCIANVHTPEKEDGRPRKGAGSAASAAL